MKPENLTIFLFEIFKAVNHVTRTANYFFAFEHETPCISNMKPT